MLKIAFEVYDTDPESDTSKMLAEIDKWPYAEREKVIGELMIARGVQILEAAAGSKAVNEHYRKKNERAAATRAAKKTPSSH